MTEKLVSHEIKEALAACDDLRMMNGPMMSEAADQKITRIETMLRHLLNIIAEKSHVPHHSSR